MRGCSCRIEEKCEFEGKFSMKKEWEKNQALSMTEL